MSNETHRNSDTIAAQPPPSAGSWGFTLRGLLVLTTIVGLTCCACVLSPLTGAVALALLTPAAIRTMLVARARALQSRPTPPREAARLMAVSVVDLAIAHLTVASASATIRGALAAIDARKATDWERLWSMIVLGVVAGVVGVAGAYLACCWAGHRWRRDVNR